MVSGTPKHICERRDEMSELRHHGRVYLTVAIPTYLRPDSLATLLSKLAPRAAELPNRYVVKVIVVDNDPQASCRAVVTEGTWGLPVYYFHEPTPGIAAARRRLLAEAVDQQLLVFIDDDEWPLPGWLAELVSTWETTGAAAVLGRVETVLPKDVDPWVRAYGMFEQTKRTPGQRLPAAPTNNLLLDLTQVRKLGVNFDLRLGMRGGEDSLFTHQLVARGGSIVACPTSVVRDDLSSDRATREFSLRRARFRGITQVDIHLRLAQTKAQQLRVRLVSTAKGVVWIVLGALRRGWGAARGSLVDSAWGARHMQRGFGLLQGAWGTSTGEYERK